MELQIKPHYKPIFDQEKGFYEKELGIPIPKDSWFYKQQIFHSGHLYCSFKITEQGLQIVRLNKLEQKFAIVQRPLIDKPDIPIQFIPTQSLIPKSMPIIHDLIRQHEPRLTALEDEAISFIHEVDQRYPIFKYIGFSTGKDSMVVAELVRRALGKIPILHNDTTIEIPDTEAMIQTFQQVYDWPITIAKHKRSFYEELTIHSFPSATQRWCCEIMKNEAIMEYVAGRPAVAFLGIRAAESPLRAKRSRIDQNNPYMKNQIAAHPILAWSTLDVWLYTFWRGILINEAYQKGFARIGCFLCPVASLMNHFLMDYYYPELWQGWLHTLSEFITYRHGIQEIPFRKEEKWVHTANRLIRDAHIKCAKCRKIICWKGKRYNQAQGLPARKWQCLSCHAKKEGIPKRYLRRVIDKKVIKTKAIKTNNKMIKRNKELVTTHNQTLSRKEVSQR